MPDSAGAPLLGLLSAASWGGGDFCGGVASRRAPAAWVVVIGFASGLLIFVAAAWLSGERCPSTASLGWSFAAGLAAAVGLGALYRGLAAGHMSIVAPVSAVLSATVPALWGVLTEGWPTGWKLPGFALALVGIWLVARPSADGRARRGLGLAVVAGAGFGAFLILMHAGAREGPFWPLVAARAASLVLAIGVAVMVASPWPAPRSGLPLAVLSGALDAGGNAFFVLAGRAGRLDVAAILSSMYPAGTIALASLLLGERVTRAQAVGVAMLLVAVALIAR